MGQALPGFVVGTVDESIALSVDESPLMWFSGYVDAPEQTRERFTPDGDWYLTGDVGRADGADFFFASRDDDVILAAGYRIAPFDIESILVADAAVIEPPSSAVPTRSAVRSSSVRRHRRGGRREGRTRGRRGAAGEGAAGEDLQSRLQAAVRSMYGAHAYPRRVHVVAELPKTPSGKVQRFVLRDMEV